MHKSWKAVAGLCMLLGTLFVTSSVAGAQDDTCGGGGYFDPVPTLEATYPATVTAGGSITFEGSLTGVDVTAGSIEFEIAGRSVGSVDASDDGSFTATFTVPNVAAGDYSVVATFAPCDLVAEGDLTIAARGTDPGNNNNRNRTTTGTTPLARTGFDATPMITLGAAALVLGAAAVYGSKRRRTV